VVAVAFQPVREAVTAGANRLVYGSRATPYEVLADFAADMAGTYSTAELIPRITQTVSQSLDDATVEVWLVGGTGLERAGRWPAEEGNDVSRLSVGGMDLLPGDRVVPVRHRDELLGALTVARSSGEPVTPTEDELLVHVASQTGLVLRNLRLVEDLQSSRERLVSMADRQRRRLERDLHDGAQQSLVAITLTLRMASRQADPDALAAAASSASRQLQTAVAELRELARGLHPAILTERGTAAALTALAERCPIPVRVDSTLRRRLPGPVEGALYFVAAESLTNVARYARARSAQLIVLDLEHSVSLEVVDDGVGGADETRGTGLLGLSDRVAVVDGTFEVYSPPGGGTRIRCVVPLPAPAAVPRQRSEEQHIPEPARSSS
jgi:signal transduction histidine kinase